jgi:hypothetical protein
VCNDQAKAVHWQGGQGKVHVQQEQGVNEIWIYGGRHGGVNEKCEATTYFDIMACVARLNRSKPPSEAAMVSNLQDVPRTPVCGDLER